MTINVGVAPSSLWHYHDRSLRALRVGCSLLAGLTERSNHNWKHELPKDRLKYSKVWYPGSFAMFYIGLWDIWLIRLILYGETFPNEKVAHSTSPTLWVGAVESQLIFHCRGRDSNALLSWTNSIILAQVKYWHFSLQNNIIFQILPGEKRGLQKILKSWGGSLKRQDRQMIQGINSTTHSVWCSANCEEKHLKNWECCPCRS